MVIKFMVILSCNPRQQLKHSLKHSQIGPSRWRNNKQLKGLSIMEGKFEHNKTFWDEFYKRVEQNCSEKRYWSLL